MIRRVDVVATLTRDLADSRPVCQPSLPRPGFHDHARVRVESPQPVRAHELLRPAQLPGALLALGAARLLPVARQLGHSRPDG